MTGATERYLCFALGSEEYGIPLLTVREVVAPSDTTPVPQTPPHFLGLMNLRGQVISIIDLRSKLGIKSEKSTEMAIIICDLHPNPVGIIVDAVNSVISPAADEISQKPEVETKSGSDYIISIYRREKRLVLLLDIAKALGSADLKIAAKVTGGRAA